MVSYLCYFTSANLAYARWLDAVQQFPDADDDAGFYAEAWQALR